MAPLCGSKCAFATDWAVTYYRSEALPALASALCPANDKAEATKEVTIQATLHWVGAGPAPKLLKVKETAVVSWSAHLTIAQDSQTKGNPPDDPQGTMTGSGQTGLTDVPTNVPNPWTTSTHGESVVGTRNTLQPVNSHGNCSLPAVTLKAKAEAKTRDQTTGSADVTISSYSVDNPGDDFASATATASVNLGTGWTASPVDYGEADDGSYGRDATTPTITVSVGSGISKEKDLSPSQTFTYTGSQNNPIGSAATSVSGAVRYDSGSNFAASLAEITGSAGGKPAFSSGSAPKEGNLTYGGGPDDSHSSSLFNPTAAVHNTQTPVTTTVVVTMHLQAKARTVTP